MRIVAVRLPGIEQQLANQVVRFVQQLRKLNLIKAPGIAETLDWAQALISLNKNRLDEIAVEETLGCLSKAVEDMAKIRAAGIKKLIGA